MDNNVMPLLERLVEQQSQVLNELKEQRLQIDAQRRELVLHKEELDGHRQELASQRKAIETKQNPKIKKDLWDRVGAIAPILSAFIIAAIGAYFTYTYNLQQLKVQEIQTIEKFMPHLTGDEKSKRAAILAINSLGNAQLAAKVASIYASEGTASALQVIAEKSQNQDKAMIKDALAQTLDALAEKYKYENKFDDAVDTYKRALALKEETFGKDSPELAENLDKLARLYELHGDHAAAAQMLKRANALRGGHGNGLEQTADAGDEGSTTSAATSSFVTAEPKHAGPAGQDSRATIEAPSAAKGVELTEPQATSKSTAGQHTTSDSHPPSGAAHATSDSHAPASGSHTTAESHLAGSAPHAANEEPHTQDM